VKHHLAGPSVQDQCDPGTVIKELTAVIQIKDTGLLSSSSAQRSKTAQCLDEVHYAMLQ